VESIDYVRLMQANAARAIRELDCGAAEWTAGRHRHEHRALKKGEC
jgi:hypothetical protein